MAILIVGTSRVFDLLGYTGLNILHIQDFYKEFKEILSRLSKDEVLLILAEDKVYKEVKDFLESSKINNRIILLEMPIDKIDYKKLIKEYLSYELEV